MKSKQTFFVLAATMALSLVRCMSESGQASQLGLQQHTELASLVSVPTGQTLFSPEFKGRTFYRFSENTFCNLGKKRVPTWVDAIKITEDGRAVRLGDRCTPSESVIADPSAIEVLPNKRLLTFESGLYEMVEKGMALDQLHTQPYTAAYCVLDHQTLALNVGFLREDLYFQVLKNPATKSITYEMMSGNDETSLVKRVSEKPILNYSTSDRVTLYQFDNHYSAYVSLTGSVLRHPSSFTVYNESGSTSVGSGTGTCYVNTITY